MGNNRSLDVSSTHLDDQMIDEITKKTGFSRNEVIKWHQEFLRDCPNGRLEKKQFIKIYKQLYPYGNSTKFCNICFLAFDKDKSGYIDFFEFITTMGILSKGGIEDKLKLAFDIYDYNDDGFIEKKEAEKIVQSLYQLYGENVSSSAAKQQVEKLMKKFDLDNNNKLSEKEFVDGCLQDEEMRKFFSFTR